MLAMISMAHDVVGSRVVVPDFENAYRLLEGS